MNPRYDTTKDSDIASEQDDSDYDEDSSTDDSEADENIESELITDQTISYLDFNNVIFALINNFKV